MQHSLRTDSRLDLLSLPSEILRNVLTHLDCQELIKCRLVCSHLNGIISSDSELLYIIELTKNGMTDSGRMTTSYAERLSSLIDRHRAWRDLHWKNVTSVDVYGPCAAHDLAGGVFATTSGQDMSFYWLPSASSPGHTVHIEDVGLQVRDFAIDPTQDLVVLFGESTTNDFSRNVRLHVRTISTMEPHPKAQLDDLRLNIHDRPIGNQITAVSLQIASDIVAVFLTMDFLATRLILWNWQDGQLFSDSEENRYEVPYVSWDFAFVSPRSFMLTKIEDDGAIMLYKFSYPDKPIPVHVATLRMPPLHNTYTVLFLCSHSGPFLANPPHGTNFTTEPESRIQVLTIGYRYTNLPLDYCGFLYVHNKTFQKYIERYERMQEDLSDEGAPQTATESTDVPWRDWGPENSHINIVLSPPHCSRFVQGTRVACPLEVYDGRTVMGIYDFNVLPGQQSQKSGGRPDNSTMIAPLLFREPLRTHLPYHLRRRAVEEDCGGFMIDEERVIGLKVDPENTEDVAALHVYCF